MKDDNIDEVFELFGITLEERRRIKHAFFTQRSTMKTKRRKDKLGNEIEFNLTFEEWLRIWVESGHLHERGCRKGQYVMSRKGDIGNYEVGNVEIKQQSDNIVEAQTGRKRSEEANRKIVLAKTGKKHPPRSQEYREKMSIAQRGKVRPKAICSTCGKEVPVPLLARWHKH